MQLVRPNLCTKFPNLRRVIVCSFSNIHATWAVKRSQRSLPPVPHVGLLEMRVGRPLKSCIISKLVRPTICGRCNGVGARKLACPAQLFCLNGAHAIQTKQPPNCAHKSEWLCASCCAQQQRAQRPKALLFGSRPLRASCTG